MKSKEFAFSNKLEVWNNGVHKGSWWFVSIDKATSKTIKDATTDMPRKGFGSIKVEAMVGYTKWQTSIFPDSKSGTYLLFIKKSIREELHMKKGMKVSGTVKVL